MLFKYQPIAMATSIKWTPLTRWTNERHFYSRLQDQRIQEKPMPPDHPPTLKAEDLYRSFAVGKNSIEVLRGVSIEVSPGEKVFLCGPSGAGKTTLLYTLAGLEEPESGEVFIDGKPLYRSSRSQRAIIRNRFMGYVFQNYFLLPDLTALENVLLPSMIRGQAARSRGLELLKKVGLADRSDHLPAEMSGGEQQRTAIARALMNDPPIVFADEPPATSTRRRETKSWACFSPSLTSLPKP